MDGLYSPCPPPASSVGVGGTWVAVFVGSVVGVLVGPLVGVFVAVLVTVGGTGVFVGVLVEVGRGVLVGVLVDVGCGVLVAVLVGPGTGVLVGVGNPRSWAAAPTTPRASMASRLVDKDRADRLFAFRRLTAFMITSNSHWFSTAPITTEPVVSSDGRLKRTLRDPDALLTGQHGIVPERCPQNGRPTR